MPRLRPNRSLLLVFLLVATLLLSLPHPAQADGGPILSDPQLWSLLKEGQQIAVITLGTDDTAHVDLFVSMLDESGTSHEIAFFIPLGMQASDFQVVEDNSLGFDSALTAELDDALRTEAQLSLSFRRNVRWAWLMGTMLINGAWSWPLWLAWSLTSCAPGGSITPVATYQTPSSSISIYGLDPNTDLQALIQATGLDPSVQGVLSRLRGQQIAVVQLRTQPAEGGTGSGSQGQPGLRLRWTTALVAQPGGPAYSYPLGTGSAWARPIESTRIYVVAPPGADFSVQYPRLGRDLSGYTLGGWWTAPTPRIQGADSLAYAVENAVGDWGRMWRVTYMHTNSAEDVVITRLSGMSRETQGNLARIKRQRVLQPLTWPISLLTAVLTWLVAWRFLMPRLLGVRYGWRDLRLYGDALRWALLYPVVNVLALAGGFLFVALGALAALVVGVPLLLVTLSGAVGIALFVRGRSRGLGVSQGRALLAYAAVVLLANAMYLVCALGYAMLLGV